MIAVAAAAVNSRWEECGGRARAYTAGRWTTRQN